MTRSKITIRTLTNHWLPNTQLTISSTKRPFLCKSQCWMSHSIMKPLVTNKSWPDPQQAAGNQVFKHFKTKKNIYISQFLEKNDCQPGWSSEEIIYAHSAWWWRCLLHQKKMRYNLTSETSLLQQPLVAPHNRPFGKNGIVVSLVVPSVICLLICLTFNSQ